MEHNKRLHNARFINHTARTMAYNINVYLTRSLASEAFQFRTQTICCVFRVILLFSLISHLPLQNSTHIQHVLVYVFSLLHPTLAITISPPTRRISFPLSTLRWRRWEYLPTQHSTKHGTNFNIFQPSTLVENYFQTHSSFFFARCCCCSPNSASDVSNLWFHPLTANFSRFEIWKWLLCSVWIV